MKDSAFPASLIPLSVVVMGLLHMGGFFVLPFLPSL